jgi:SAM-dependent methyltransferase
MKTLLFAPMWLDKENRLERNIKWLRYMRDNDIFTKLGVDKLFFVDNASSDENIELVKQEYPSMTIHRCTEFLARTSHLEYPYWYRAFAIAAQYAKDNGYEKIIHIDTDVYVLSERICTHIKTLNSGWNAFWCPRHNFAESTFQVIGSDKIEEMRAWMAEGYKKHYPCDAEHVIPWTNIIKTFDGDRYGEIRAKQIFHMDYYGQCHNDIDLVFKQRIGEESSKTYIEKHQNGFFKTYMSGTGCEIGYAGYVPGSRPILYPNCHGFDLNTPGYDGKHIPVENNHYPWLYSSHTLEHIQDYKETIREWYRVVRSGGYIVTVVPHRDLYENKLELPSQFNGDHKHFFTPASLLKYFEDSLPINSFRVRHLKDRDEGHDYNGKVPCWLYEIELVIQKL